jgi:hypothetical protein
MIQNNNLSVAVGVSALVIIYIVMYVISFNLIHQIIDFLLTYRSTGLGKYR